MRRSFTQNPASSIGNLVQPARQTIIKLRTHRGWTQEKLAEKSILAVRTIQNLEQGNFTRLRTISRVAEALGVSTRECIEGAAPTESQIGRASAVEDGAPPCPYRGQLAFREEDADVFFGREVFVDLLKEKLTHKNIIQVSGPSGSGKSSLIAAGLIHALKASGSWQVLYCRPGGDPFEALASALIPYFHTGPDQISRAAQLPKLREVLEQGQLFYLLKQLVLAGGGDGLLLFIDQFEELYTQCSTQSVRDSFLDSAVPLVSAGPNLRLVYTIRADFAYRLLSHRRFIDAIQDSDVKIGPMDRDELESVIRNPASQRNVKFEDGLVERILNDAGAEPGALPLLEFALTELWSRQADRTLTHAAYERIGQLAGAIAHRAEKVYRSLSGQEQEAARHILTRLVRLADEGGEDTRQRIALSALYSEDLLNSDSGRKVLGLLAEARLVAIGVESGHDQQMVEIAHEALVRRWPRLHQWLQDDREVLIWRQRLRLLIREWQQTGREEGFLVRGPLLDEARLWLSRRSSELTPEENDFINSSLSLWHRERSTQPLGATCRQPRTGTRGICAGCCRCRGCKGLAISSAIRNAASTDRRDSSRKRTWAGPSITIAEFAPQCASSGVLNGSTCRHLGR
ncbi:MAG TPA: helix-turn-helix transcriptional regulator [Bryobacteraceae bacterium]|nr:helix-turn-helix transcriptional regulator [Bryobacteraceae bacterium]